MGEDHKISASPPFRETNGSGKRSVYDLLVKRFIEIGKSKAKLEELRNDKRTGRVVPEAAKSFETALSAAAIAVEGYVRNPQINAWLDELEKPEAYGSLDEIQQAMVREMRLSHSLDTALSSKDAIKAKKIETDGRAIHARAMKANDWDSAKKHPREVIKFQQRVGRLYAQTQNSDDPLDGMLAVWSPGVSRQQVDEYFERLERKLKPMVTEAIFLQKSKDKPEVPEVEFSVEKRKQLNARIAEDTGLDMDRGGLLYSENAPIEGGTRNKAFANLKEPDGSKQWHMEPVTANHEGAHERYIQNTPEEWEFTPLGEDRGGLMQEGVALLSEMVIGRTREYMRYFAREAEEVYGQEFDADNLFRLRSRVERTPERKTADELTYHLHVIARWRAYCALIEDKVDVDEYPERLAEIYRDTVGVNVEDPVKLALSDVHLFVGKGALYPSYTLGHGLACQLFDTMKKAMPDMLENIGSDGPKGLQQAHQWLVDKVFSAGRLYTLNDLMQRVTGKAPDPEYQLAHLRQRFLGEDSSPALRVSQSGDDISAPCVKR